MSHYSLRIIFPVSRSKNYDQAVKLASEFSNFKSGKRNIVDISIKEIFEKWEFFNLLFWRTVDWKGTVLEWEGMLFHSHTDKTRIFYALQHSHVSYICYLEDKIRNLHKVHIGDMKYEELEAEGYTEDDMNWLIDTFQIIKKNRDVKNDEQFKNINVRERPWFLRNNM